MTHPKELVVLYPAPQSTERIFAPVTLRRLQEEFEVLDLEGDPDAERQLDLALPRAFAVVGQPDLSAERVERAVSLRALCNVEGNFFPNVDYAACADRGVHVLGCGPAYAQAVAEYSLGLALDLARGITREDRAFRAGAEGYTFASNTDSILLRGAEIGLIGFGNLGRALHELLVPFRATIRVYDPWLPERHLEEHGVIPASLDEVLETSQVLFVLATITEESERLLSEARLRRLRPGARLVLVSRAAVADFTALIELVSQGHFLAALDVWPEEPVTADHPARAVEGLVLSAHRAGGIPAAFEKIGEMVLDDLLQIRAGLPPVRMQVAARELVHRYRSRPVTTAAGARNA
ncbi:NAD(P)-dependent oxidoreductase [Streptomyces hawaiiensis]|uniref:NAD(P)-dependent oxidoreductase n=1 Tax=Streptomyces hawaiiensis TaxID=67305 RepID=UPI00364D51B8